MSDDLDAIKGNPAVIRVYNSILKLRSLGGGKYQGLCPLPGHSEKSPSFTVYPDMRAHCFGCNQDFNIFTLLQAVEGIDFKQALEKVKKEIGGWEEAKETTERAFKPIAPTKVFKTIPLSNFQKLEEALEYSVPAREWLLKERGLIYEAVKRLHVGFVQSIGNLAGQDGADIADKGWIAFPCIEGDKVISIKYRSIIRKKPGGFARQPGMATALWNSETIDVFEPVYLTEGEFDSAALEAAGFHAVSVPSAGVKLTPEQKDQLMKAAYVVLSGDNDPTGSGYMKKLWGELNERCYLLTWPDGCKDANQALKENCKGDIDKFREMVDSLTSKAKSTPVPDVYAIQEIMKNSEDTSLADRADRLRFPWSNVDKMTILLPGSVLGLTSTNTSMGKTPFAIQGTLFGARKYQEVVVNWQCELSPAEISVIVAAQVLHKNRNFLGKEDLKQAAEQLDGVAYYVGNNPVITNIMEVLDIMEAAIRRLGATVAVLDNLHFYTTGIDDENRVQTAAIKRIKQIAGTYGCKWIVVGQPRKASAQSKGKKTHITDAKGSGSFGDTCDSFMAIHREVAKRDGDEELSDIYEDKVLVEMLKTRSKGTGKSSGFLTFFGEFAEFVQLDTHHEEEPE